MATNKQSDKKKTKQVRIDVELHKRAKVRAAEAGVSLRSFVEGYLAEPLGVDPKK